MHSNIVKENFIIKNLVFAIELLYHIYLILLKQIYKKKMEELRLRYHLIYN